MRVAPTNQQWDGEEQLLEAHEDVEPHRSSKTFSKRERLATRPMGWIICGLLTTGVGILLYQVSVNAPGVDVPSNSFSTSMQQTNELKRAVRDCLSENSRTPDYGGNARSPEQTNQGAPLLVRNAMIYTGRQDEPFFLGPNYDIIVIDGSITAIGIDLSSPPGATVVDANGQFLTPGIVDLHSHLGVDAWPELFGNADFNENSDPRTPYVNSIDGFNPDDPAIEHVLAGGVTTAQILPGSSNVMGGEAVAVKMIESHDVTDMLIDKELRAMKWACGENPKRGYGARFEMPRSRLGATWLMREILDEARRLDEAQRTWCEDSVMRSAKLSDASSLATDESTKFPYDLRLDQLVALLRNELRVNVHCYMSHDMTMVLRLADEFNFSVGAFHHALESWQLADRLARENVASAIFVDDWGFKYEGYFASVWASMILHDAGAPLVIKSDHPVLDSSTLMFEGSKAVHYGLPPEAAIAVLSSGPARVMGLQDSLGSISVGLDGDFALWDRDPLVIGSMPTDVYINGVRRCCDNGIQVDENAQTHTELALRAESVRSPEACPGVDSELSTQNYAVRAQSIYTQDPSTGVISDGLIVVRDGIVACVGTVARCGSQVPPDFTLFDFDAQPSVEVVPGFVFAGADLGQVELVSETTGENGELPGDGADGLYAENRAYDGIRFTVSRSNKHIVAARKGGILTAISVPQGNNIVSGLSTTFSTCCSEFVDDTVIDKTTALHINLGNGAKRGGLTSSISGQFLALRRLFTRAREHPLDTDQPLVQALEGVLPVVATVDSAAVIRLLLEVKREFGFRLVLLGASEAYLVADELAREDVGVLFRESTAPESFDTFLATRDGAVQLVRAGVKVGLVLTDRDFARNIRWEAGKAVAIGLTEQEALDSITSNVADILGLPSHIGRIVEGQRANFLAFDEKFYHIQSHVRLLAAGDRVLCDPLQDSDSYPGFSREEQKAKKVGL